MIPPSTPSPIWVERYETLRHHVLSRRALVELQPLGMVLWLAQGMAGWMRRWTEAAEVVLSSVPVPRPLPYPTTPLWQQQVTLLLAQITVQRLYPALSL